MDINEEEWKKYTETIKQIKHEMSKVIVGQEQVIEQMLWCVFAGGHALLEGIPGLGKTMLVKTASEALDLTFSRIQFTPDLMPADITGTNIIHFGEKGQTEYQFQQGPIFGNLVLADEINRATPKTQSALLEAMQEKTVTVGSETRRLPRPFFVLATQNPLENEGTYPLPEAQLDRFLLKIDVDYPTREQLKEIVRRTTISQSLKAEKAAGEKEIIAIQEAAKSLLLSDDVLEEAVRILMMTHPDEAESTEEVKKYVRYGSGPRGIQAIISTAKVRALFHGRFNVSLHDIRETAIPALRHRILLNFEGEADGMTTDLLLHQIIAHRDNEK